MKTVWSKSTVKILQVLNWVFFGVMIFVNYLANALPLNGKTTGAVSAQYPNLFVPAPITFSIWGVIYLLLLVFCIKQSKSLFSSTVDEATGDTVSTVGAGFMITSILNALWILSWHYGYIQFSVVVMLLLLAQLVHINLKVKQIAPFLASGSRFTVKAAFGTYLGWICIATIANITALLVDSGWSGWGNTETFWACTMILVGALITTWTLFKTKNAYLGLSVIWAFCGILIARINADVYYRFIAWSAVFGALFLTAMVIIEFTRSLFRSNSAKTVVITSTHERVIVQE